jgi:Zn-finger nucleic acid-binding protein
VRTPVATAEDPDHTDREGTVMKCPHCAVDLVMSERQGIEIDYCPTCRGVWLDRGELDKLIERSLPARADARDAGYERRDDRHGDHHSGHHDDHGPFGKHRRKSFLADLFD